MNEIAHWRNPRWRYADSKETSEPGYLARKFAKLRAEQKRNQTEAEAKVQTLRRKHG